MRSVHYQQILHRKPPIAWLEGHSENFFASGGLVPYVLEQVRLHYPLSLHGVGLSLGSATPLDTAHLKRLKEIVDIYQPALVSEHISWSNTGSTVLNDLLPLPYTEEALKIVCRNIDYTQEYLGRQILVENPSTYLEFESSDMEEYEFMAAAAKKSGCGILFDVNNIYVGHMNHGMDLDAYLEHLPVDAVQEIHLAGHAVREIEGQSIRIDHHGDFICDEVWQLYRKAIQKLGPVPTLIEWDTDIPSLETLMDEAAKAQAILDQECRNAFVA